MSMSKKTYVDFARMIRTQRHQAVHKIHDSMIEPSEHVTVQAIRQEQIDSIVSELCDLFESDNPNFRRSQFVAACEIDTESK